MVMQSENYAPIRGFASKELPHPKTSGPILLKDGTELSGVTPRAFFASPSPGQDKKTLTMDLLYEDANNKTAVINADKIRGLKVITEGKDVFIEATYYRPPENILEVRSRLLKVKDIMYGIHPNHAKVHEKPDFYIVADDKKYLDEGKTGKDAERSFPFWRLGIYGDPKTVQKFFQPDNS